MVRRKLHKNLFNMNTFMLLMIWMGKKLLEPCMKKLQKTDEKEFSIEKVIKRPGNKLYVKWKGYDNLFDSWQRRHCIKWVSTFLDDVNLLKETLKSKLIYLIMQQKQN